MYQYIDCRNLVLSSLLVVGEDFWDNRSARGHVSVKPFGSAVECDPVQ